MSKPYWSFNVRCAASILQYGGVITHPTEAVWGLACDPANYGAVQKILELKNRPEEKGLILVSGQATDFDFLTRHLNEAEQIRFTTRQDRPTTWLLPDPFDEVPSFIKGRFKSVAVRVTDHPLVKSLCDCFGGPIVSTSANPAGLHPALNIRTARHYFWHDVDAYLNGPLGGADQPSQILDITSQAAVRV